MTCHASCTWSAMLSACRAVQDSRSQSSMDDSARDSSASSSLLFMPATSPKIKLSGCACNLAGRSIHRPE
jgi:hypothetical protein